MISTLKSGSLHEYILEGRPWLKKVMEASRKKELYLHGILSLKKQMDLFYQEGLDQVEYFQPDYKPNPFKFQYDLELHIFIEWDYLKKKEIKRLKKKLEGSADEALSERIQKRLKIVEEVGPSGIPRHEHLFNAAEIRWPSTVYQGKVNGQMLRDPWSVRRFESLCDSSDYVVNFGGGGQGKTHCYLAFGLMMFEHFIFTERGAKCSFSTVNETKIKGSTWPHLLRLHSSSKKDISLYAGRSVIGGGPYTIKRPNTKDTGSVYKGILVGQSSNVATVTDKLTGTHGHDLYFYLIDEAQSSSIAPIEASSNYKASGKPTFIILTGNYDSDSDTLGVCTKPIGGWDKVDKNTEKWYSIIDQAGGAKALVLHFNNENSPAILDPKLAKRFPYLPNERKRDKIYAKSKQNQDNRGYRRFWIGFRATDLDEDSILTAPMVESGRADKDLNLLNSYPIHHFGSFDGAQGQGDRNVFGHFAHGMDAQSEEWVWGCQDPLIALQEVSNIKDYFFSTSNELRKLCRMFKIDSGCLVMDWSNMNGHVSRLREMGFDSYPIQYQKKIPDGATVKGYSGEIEPAILVNPYTEPMLYAHQVCHLRNSLGAWALQQYVKAGRVRGLNEDMIRAVTERSLEEEMFRRKFNSITTMEHGERLKLDSKTDFMAKYGFSTDVFDVWIQAAYYMLVNVGMPVYDEVLEENRERRIEEEIKRVEEQSNGESLIMTHNSLWDDDIMEGDSFYYAEHDDELLTY